SHYLTGLHPWANLIVPRSTRILRDPDLQAGIVLDNDVYRQLPVSGYLSHRFSKSLFPQVPIQADRPPETIPFIELQHIEDAIFFRQRTSRLITQVLAGQYRDEDTGNIQRQPLGEHPTIIVPPVWNKIRPVLYQVVSTAWGTGVILEAKDFFTIGPDRRDLHCIILDNYAINLTSGYRGFDKFMISVKDFVWVYDVKPSVQAMQNPHAVLRKSRIPRTTVLESNSAYFFRVDHFAFVTPRQRDDKIYGIVLSTLVRRERIQSFQAAFEDAPDPVVVPPSVCAFDIATVQPDEMLLAESRYNVSTAIRFSEPPVSVQAQNQLCDAIRHTLPMHPSEGLLPLKVFRLDPSEYAWLDDRMGKFDSFHDDPKTAKRKMSKLFNVACSALAALDSLVDDKISHWVTATIP
ncbi:unnamed protein product, partial [Cylicostephanus goldi]